MLPPSNPHGSQYILPLYLSPHPWQALQCPSQCSHTAFTSRLQSWWPSSALHTSTTAHSPYLAYDHAPALLARPNNTCHGLQPARPSHLIASHQACQQDYVGSPCYLKHFCWSGPIFLILHRAFIYLFIIYDSRHGTCNIRYDGNMYEISRSMKCKNREKIYAKKK